MLDCFVTAGKLVKCTEVICPNGWQDWVLSPGSVTDGSWQFVNRAPHSGIGGIAGMVNSFQTPAYKKAVYDLFAYFSSPNVSLEVVSD